MGTKVTATYITSNAMDWIHLQPHGIAFQVTPEILRAYLAPDVDWGNWKPSLHDDGVAGEPENYGDPIAVRHDTKPVEVLEPETWARRLAFFEVEADPVTRIDWDTTSDPSNPGWVARQGRLDWPVQGCDPDATDAELVDAADAWAPAGVYVAAAKVDRAGAVSNRISFEAWGSNIGSLDLPAYAMADPDGIESRAARVAAAIARKNGLEVITMRGDGTALTNGKPSSNHYQVTLGRPCPGDGWPPTHEIWISVPVAVDHA